MAISVRSTSTNSDNPVHAISISAPSGTTTGDIVLVLGYRNSASTDGSQTLIDDNGSTPFTKQRGDIDTFGGAELSIFYRRIQSGDPSTYNFKFNVFDGDTTISLVAICFQSPDPSVVFDVIPDGTTVVVSSGDSGSINADDITTTVNGCIHVIAWCREGGSSGFTNTPSGYTRPYGDGSLHGGMGVVYKTITTAGATGAQNLVGTGSGTPVIQSFAIRNTAGTQYNSSPSGVISHAGSLSAFIKLPKYTVKIG